MKLLADLTPLRESPAFRRLWAGSTLSAVGGAMTSFALTLQVWDLTRSTAAVGLVALATLLPLLAVGLFGGALIDAVDTRRLVLGCTSALAAVSALLTVRPGSAWTRSACSTRSPPSSRRSPPSTSLPAGRSPRRCCPPAS